MDNNKYLQQVLASQDLPDNSQELQDLQSHRKDVDQVLRAYFSKSSPSIRYGGSHAKGTMIRDYYDLDIACYFPHDDTAAGTNLKDI
jgi:tRNA nucleotidyltransferase (CCA-adding enzyme)